MGTPIDVRHAEFKAMTDVFLGEDFDPVKLQQVEDLQVEAHRNQAALARRHERHELSDDEYIAAANASSETAFRRCESILGAETCSKLFGVSVDEVIGLIDRTAFLDNSPSVAPPPRKTELFYRFVAPLEVLRAIKRLADESLVEVSAPQALDSTSEPLNAPINPGDMAQSPWIMTAVFPSGVAALDFIDKLIPLVADSKRPIKVRKPGTIDGVLITSQTDSAAVRRELGDV
jgi:hypothetical protein